MEGRSVLASGSFLARHDFSDPDRNRLEAEEVFIETSWDSFSLQAGRAMVSWGTASLSNPTDVINPMDRRDLAESEKLGTWMLRSGFILGPIQIEGYYLPVPEAHRLPLAEGLDADGIPSSRSRWFLDAFPRGGNGESLIVYQIGASSPPPATLKNGQFALRLATSLPGFDFSLGYAYLYDRIPTLHQRVSPPDGTNPNTRVELSLAHQRIHFITADFESVLGKVRLAGEFLLALTADRDDSDPEVDNPYFSMVAGADMRSGQFLADHCIHFFLELTYTRALAGQLVAGPMSLLRHPLDLAALGRLRYEWGQQLHLDLNLISGLDKLDLIINPEIEWLIIDRISAKIGLLLLFGSGQNSLLHQFEDNRRLTASIELTF